MAKKKPTRQGIPPQNQYQDHIHQSPASMEEASEKLENLKSLNSMLLKETAERRHQVDSLVRSKVSIESALTRSEMEIQALQAELTWLNDRMAQLHLERDLVLVFVAVQVGQQAEVVEKERDELWRERVEIDTRLENLVKEMGEVRTEKEMIEKVSSEKQSEIRILKDKLSDLQFEIGNERDESMRVSVERAALRAELDIQIEETNGLKLKLIEEKKRGKMIEEETEKLMVEYNRVMHDKEEKERRIEVMTKDKDSIEKSFGKSNQEIEGLKREIEEIVREKETIDKKRNVEAMKKHEMQISLVALNEIVLGLQKEERMLRANILDLEKQCVVREEKEKQMENKIDELLNEKKERESSFENLVEEKGLVKEELDEALKELGKQKQKIEEIIRKKIEIEEVMVRKESENFGMQRKVSELRLTISSLEKSCRYQTENNGKLQSDVNQCRDAISQVTFERDQSRKGFDEEKQCRMILTKKISEMEKNNEETQKVVDDLKAEKWNVIEEKKELEIKCTKLVNEIESMKISLSKARKEVDDVKRKVESSDANGELILKMLRTTAAAMLCVSKGGTIKENDGFVTQNNAGESLKLYVAELEAIKNAFKNREIKVEDMKRQLELLQNSVAEAHKGKNFLTVLSSATAVLAAAVAFVAYAAHGR